MACSLRFDGILAARLATGASAMPSTAGRWMFRDSCVNTLVFWFQRVADLPNPHERNQPCISSVSTVKVSCVLALDQSAQNLGFTTFSVNRPSSRQSVAFEEAGGRSPRLIRANLTCIVCEHSRCQIHRPAVCTVP